MSIRYGRGTKWCISATKSENYYFSYRLRGVSFYFLFKNDKRYAIGVTDNDFELFRETDVRQGSGSVESSILLKRWKLSDFDFKKIPLSNAEIDEMKKDPGAAFNYCKTVIKRR